MRRYIAGWYVEGRVEVLGVVQALDVVEATERARRRWPGAGVFPWRSATREQRAEARRERQENLKV